MLGLIPFAALSFFIAIYFGSIRRAQVMKQQNVIASSDQQIWIRDDKKKESSVSNIQSKQKSVDYKRSISRVKHCDAQIDTNRTFSITKLGISGINERGNTILKDTRPKINDETAVNSSMQLQSSCSSIYRDAPTISSIIVIGGERNANRNQSSYQITSTPFTRNLTLTPKTPLTSLKDKTTTQKILNNSLCELVSSHRTAKHTSSERTRKEGTKGYLTLIRKKFCYAVEDQQLMGRLW
uniref:Uncharacterized protein n=1 Tax=Wuchereria bancrofti TaxID=6293 RepID=A0A1I8F0L0_WUCBA